MTQFNPISGHSAIQEESGHSKKRGHSGESDAGAVRNVQRRVQQELRGENQKRKQEGKESAAKRTKRELCQLVPLETLTRDDAFQVGLVARSRFIDAINEEMGGELVIHEDEEEGVAEAVLSKKDYTTIEEIENSRSALVGSQLFELFYSTEKQKAQHKVAAEKIRNFALELARCLPEKTREELDENAEIDPEYDEMARRMSAQLGFEFPEEELRRLAYKLQEAKAAEELMDVDDTSEEQEVTEEEITQRVLGHLILLAERNIETASACIHGQDRDAIVERILDRSGEILQEASASIRTHEKLHERTAIQNVDEAVFSRVCLEMAKLLILDSRGFNFGLIDDLLEHLLPKQFENTVAAENLTFVLAKMSDDPSIWQMIARAAKPESKEVPSNDLIRAVLQKKPNEEITMKDVQIVMVSAALDHLRQARAGTCFATCWMKQITYDHLEFALMDFVDLLKQGYLQRIIFSEGRKFPFHNQMAKGALDTQITVTGQGKMLAVKEYEGTVEEEMEQIQPHPSAYLYEAPGVLAACRALGIDDTQNAVVEALENLEKTQFYAKELLEELAKIAYARNSAISYRLRNHDHATLEQLRIRSQSAFNSQTEHPLHRAWEQVMSSLVNYFNSQYLWPNWTFQALEETMKKVVASKSGEIKKKYHKLMDYLLLPMITRMRYRYQHDTEDEKVLFEDTPQGTHGFGNYGYELCDTGLPTDFEYSKDLRRQLQNESHFMSLSRFQEYGSPHHWKVVNTPELFRDFLSDVVKQTVAHLQSEEEGGEGDWRAIEQLFTREIQKESFTKRLVENQMGKDSGQRKDLRRNDNSLHTTPWIFRWGGDYKEVQNTYFSFRQHPTQEHAHSGSPKSVLAWQINYMKKQPQEIQDKWSNPFARTAMTAPPHAFLFMPGQESFQDAWRSEMSTNEYIAEYIEGPGKAIAEAPILRTTQRKIIEYVCTNQWVRSCDEKHHLDRQELTDVSKKLLDEELEQVPNLYQMRLGEFRKTLTDAVIASRARDSRIGKRYHPWEDAFKRRLQNKIQTLIPGASAQTRLSRDEIHSLIDFARNRKDRQGFTPEGSVRLRQEAMRLPSGLSHQEFRKQLLALAHSVHQEEVASKAKDKGWIESLAPRIDNKIYDLLTTGQKKQLMESAICTADANWKNGIHAIYFIFMVNPGSGKIELCRWVPDTEEIRFMDQSHWFPHKQGQNWNLPKNYHVFEHEPLVNVKEMVEV